MNMFLVIVCAILGASCLDAMDKDLGDGYSLVVSDGYWTGIQDSSNTVIIPDNVLDCDYDSIYVIVAQRPWDSIPGIPKHELVSMNYDDRNRAFENSTFRQYWIIDKTKSALNKDSTNSHSNVYGPYSRDEFLRKRIELGVSEELKLEIENENM